jgi:very-short-patch-repair endonuclease
MIKEKEIEVVGHSRNLVHYLSLGYDAVVRKPFMVDPTHLMPGATTKVTSVCEKCGRETSNAFKDYYISTASLTTPFYCKGCNQIKNKQTSMERWGVDNPMKSKEIQEKVRSTIVERYGVDHFSKTEEYKEKYRLTKQVRKKELSLVHVVSGLTLFLRDCGVKYIQKDRTVLGGKELDFLLPDHKLAIEVNGLYWHGEKYRGKDYNADKTARCRETNIALIHVWEDDWAHRKEIVKSIIGNRIGYSSRRIYARSCEVREVSSKEARSFLDSNHIQGYASSQVRLGLYYDVMLVSLMTFGWRHTNSKRDMELIRFCNLMGTLVVGGASRLFSKFLSTCDADKIISYSDDSMFDGGLYEKLGFVRHGLSKPNYFWVVGGKRRHRFNFCKSKLVKQGFDPQKTEVQIMHDRGYRRVWGCGQVRWEYQVGK